jgi:hypothetical protein
MSKVLNLMERKMRGILNNYDYQPLPSDPNTIRWRNTAQWCRNTMVREGLLKSDSPRASGRSQNEEERLFRRARCNTNHDSKGHVLYANIYGRVKHGL